ncbi:hypothetical protein B0H19DRAFT_1276124 [Mycena capillaripes]|nr:hypothetical protein B0H19DRAFT_1276124 [Mycena capillaripes]
MSSITGPNFSVCARCKLVRYCSKACQQQDWPSHRPTCKPDPRDEAGNTAGYIAAQKLFMRWMDHWSHQALYAWAAFAANLANNPPDYLADHLFFLVIKLRKDRSAGSPSRGAFEVHYGNNISDEEFLPYIGSVMESTTPAIPHFQALPRSSTSIRWVVVAHVGTDDPYMCSSGALDLDELFPERSARSFSTRGYPPARFTAAQLRTAYEEEFHDSVRQGRDLRWNEVLRSLPLPPPHLF